MKHEMNRTVVQGKLAGFNLSPQGRPDGLLVEIDGGQIAQINFQKEAGDDIAQAIAVGEALTATVSAEPETEGAGHAVYRLLSLGDNRVSLAHCEGDVVRLNYARHGEPNGAILDSGDFIHLRPDGARAVQLRIGQHLSVEGDAAPAGDGRRAIEAHTVNGTALARKSHPTKPHGKEKHRQTVAG